MAFKSLYHIQLPILAKHDLFMVLLFLLSVVPCFSQTTETQQDDKVYTEPEVQPEYPGGIAAFYNFIAKNFRPPAKALSGKILVEFIVEKDGSLSNIRVVKDLGSGTGKEAVRLLKKSVKWLPGEHADKPVRVLHTLPINIHSN